MLYNTSGEVFTVPQNMANILQGQFSSVFSDPNNPDMKKPVFQPPEISTPMIEDHFILTDDIIIEAINKIPNASSPGLVGIPAIILKNCASELCLPINK